jgi:aryl-alcohol dehydrogenase-like predicted oxidoreductase
MGKCDKDTTFSILDFFFSQGGNFIDTASNYQDEESEKWIGEWMSSRKNRDQIVLATKFTTNWTTHAGLEGKIHANFGGNNKKSLRLSLDASLKKLQTDYIDLLYLHWWDFTTSIPEVMHSLDDMVKAGKILYLGVSDTPGNCPPSSCLSPLRIIPLLTRLPLSLLCSMDCLQSQPIRPRPRPPPIQRIPRPLVRRLPRLRA